VRLVAPVSVLANCCSAGDTVFRLMCLMSCRIRWATHADVSVPAATLRNFGRWHSRMTLMADSGTGQVAMFVIDWD